MVCGSALVDNAWACLLCVLPGAAMLGELTRSGVGVPLSVDYVKSATELKASCERSNQVLLRELREDSNAAALLKQTREDAALGRMMEPVPVAQADLSHVLLNPRFGVEQEKKDGSTKLRAIDHLSWSPSTADGAGMERRPTKKARKEASVNGYTAPAEKISHDTLDALAAALCKYVEVVGSVPGLIKVGRGFCHKFVHRVSCSSVQADVDAAFRRIPVAAEHRWACGVAIVVDGQAPC